jgi:hypothetical protein
MEILNICTRTDRGSLRHSYESALPRALFNGVAWPRFDTRTVRHVYSVDFVVLADASLIRDGGPISPRQIRIPTLFPPDTLRE